MAPLRASSSGNGRRRALLIDAVGRPLLFVAWSLVIWGTVLLAAFLWTALAQGMTVAVQRVVPAGRNSLAWTNLALMVVAGVTWILAAWIASRPRPAGKVPGASPN